MTRKPPKRDLPPMHPGELLRKEILQALDRPRADRSFATAELSDEKVQEIGASRMDERHVHLDPVLVSK
jgi:hypothetical protein